MISRSWCFGMRFLLRLLRVTRTRCRYRSVSCPLYAGIITYGPSMAHFGRRRNRILRHLRGRGKHAPGRAMVRRQVHIRFAAARGPSCRRSVVTSASRYASLVGRNGRSGQYGRRVPSGDTWLPAGSWPATRGRPRRIGWCPRRCRRSGRRSRPWLGHGHLLVPAVHAAGGVGVHREGHVLVHPGVRPPHPRGVRVGGIRS